jgi:plastocyanin
MSQDLSSRADMTGEVRFRVPLVLVIPLSAVAVIALVAWGFSRVLLSIPPGAATAVAIITAVNILGACAFLALRPNLGRASILELVLVALYPVLIGIVIAQTGIGGAEEAAAEGGHSAPAAPAVATDSIVAENTAFDAETIKLEAKKPTDFTLENQDSALHNLVIFPSEEDATDPSSALFESPDVPAGGTEEFQIDPLDKGEYYFLCAYHANMNGEVQVG